MNCNLKKLANFFKVFNLDFGEIAKKKLISVCSSRDSESNLILDKGYLVKYLSTKDKHKTNTEKFSMVLPL